MLAQPPLKKLRESLSPEGEGKGAPSQKRAPAQESEATDPSEVEALDCDGYYEDVQPIDADRQREGVDTRLILRVVLLVAGVALVIGGCVAALFLL